MDYSNWLTKQQAADAIGVSTKAIERFTRSGKLQQAFRPQAGSPHVAVYHPDDVARIAASRPPGPLPPFLVPGSGEPANGNGNGHHALAVGSVTLGADRLAPLTPGEDLFRALVTSALKVVSETSETPTLYVTVKEAAAILGLPQVDVRVLIAGGELPCRKTRRGGIRIRRRDLEAL